MRSWLWTTSQRPRAVAMRAVIASATARAAAGNGGSDGVGDNNDSVASYPSNYNTTAGAGYDAVIAVAAITCSRAVLGRPR